jgi:hypothetical protein
VFFFFFLFCLYLHILIRVFRVTRVIRVINCTKVIRVIRIIKVISVIIVIRVIIKIRVMMVTRLIRTSKVIKKDYEGYTESCWCSLRFRAITRPTQFTAHFDILLGLKKKDGSESPTAKCAANSVGLVFALNRSEHQQPVFRTNDWQHDDAVV